MSSHHVLRFPGTLAGFKDAFARLNALLDKAALDGDARYNVELVFDEIAANIVRYGRPTRDVEVRVELGDEVVLTFEDDGVAFDPRQQEPPPPPTSLEDAKVGGRGLVLVRACCTRIDYARTPEGRNRLTLVLPAD